MGHLHPLTQIISRSVEIFSGLGFTVALGPEIEEEFYNFDALNMPPGHPARAMQDTFWLRRPAGKLLRTHCTAVSMRKLAERHLPLKVVSVGRVYRNEATDATHETQFYQLDGLSVASGREVTLAHLKGALEYFYRNLFGSDIELRLRPSYFPFVEPGVEVDIKRGDKWLEVMGAGMVHRQVFAAAGLDPAKHQGWAFGGGLDRLAMLYYGVPDVRLFYQDDRRFLKQFSPNHSS